MGGDRVWRNARRVTACALLVALGWVAVSQAVAGGSRIGQATLRGQVLSGGIPVAATPVTLYRTPAGGSGPPASLGTAITRADGSFAIVYPRPSRSSAVFYVVVGRGVAVRLATVLGVLPLPSGVVVNERTTVASGFALAQFISARGIAGRFPGPQNAAAMADDLVDGRTGGLSAVLARSPNGNETSTLRTFNSLANMLVPCARSAAGCGRLFRLATPAGGSKPRGVLLAVADIAREPWHNVRKLFALARTSPSAYRPALGPRAQPDAWILALRFEGDGKTMDGPGNMAIDAMGDVWSTNNYTYSGKPLAPVCGSRLLLEFKPNGEYVSGSPYRGGGLNGAGFGITFDPARHLWVGNFGFSAVPCKKPPSHLSVSEFNLRGQPLSPSQTRTSPGGFMQGNILWPQGTVSDRQGNIWIANCGNNSVTRYAGGDPNKAQSIVPGIEKPFDIAFNAKGQAFVTGNGSSTVAMLNPDGTPALAQPISGGGLSWPLGIAADSHGNMWVSNSGAVNVTCPNGGPVKATPSVTFISSNGTVRQTPFTGGGLPEPWGLAVDGNDNVWVANFKGQRVAELCGVDPGKCPPGISTGQQISPAQTGYGFDGFVRNTGIQIDPSGNVWIANNWKLKPVIPRNPGGYQMVVVIGVAGPIRTPLIGPPRPL